MTNGYEIYKTAMILLGYSDDKGEPIDSGYLRARTLCAINEIGDDLCKMPSINGLFSPLNITKKALSAMPYGVAMMLALGDGNTEKHSVLCDLYNAKRAAVKSDISSVRDTMPR